ncbi:MAG: hypothetical protein A3K65_08535 [Euryarchaeota archaeon RBG_16_68_12]|nr:MAG: hypothetical protein A3K65_08535 [Euryarchaeota archaeon RBG_16_68_12]
MAASRASRGAIVLTLSLLLGGLATVFVAPPARAGTAIVFQDGFEDGVLGPRWNASDSDPASGLDYWGVSSFRSNAGTYSAWSAQVGTQSDTGQNNTAVQQYDDDMQADLSIDLRVNGFASLTLSFVYYTKAESGGGDWIQAWYEANGTQTIIFTTTGTARWDNASVAVPNDVERLIIRFHSDTANHGFEGAYVDDVVLTGVENSPPASSVSPLPAYTNAMPDPIPYATADGANESGVAYVQLWYRNGTSGGFTQYVRPSNPLGRWYPWASPTIPFDTSFAQGDGYYEFYTVAFDNASNVEAPPSVADANTTIDTTSPVLTLTAPSDGAWLNASSATVTWQGSDALSGIDRYETSLDGGAYSSTGTATSAQFSGLSDGPHRVAVRAHDVAGNVATATVDFGVDTTGPSPTISSPSGNDVFLVGNVTFEWTAQDAGSGVDHYEVWLDGGTHTNTTGTNLTLDPVPNGAHTFYVIAFDRVGNRGETSVTFRVDVAPPVTTPSWLWVLILIVILTFVALLVMWWKRRRDEEEAAEGEPAPEDAPPAPETDETAGESPPDTTEHGP